LQYTLLNNFQLSARFPYAVSVQLSLESHLCVFLRTTFASVTAQVMALGRILCTKEKTDGIRFPGPSSGIGETIHPLAEVPARARAMIWQPTARNLQGDIFRKHRARLHYVLSYLHGQSIKGLTFRLNTNMPNAIELCDWISDVGSSDLLRSQLYSSVLHYTRISRHVSDNSKPSSNK
jgi:hypothetical protein